MMVVVRTVHIHYMMLLLSLLIVGTCPFAKIHPKGTLGHECQLHAHQLKVYVWNAVELAPAPQDVEVADIGPPLAARPPASPQELELIGM